MRHLLMFTAVLALGLVQAQTATPSTPSTPETPSTPDDASSTSLSSLTHLVAAGSVVTLVGADGALIATLQADGTLKLEAGASLSSATRVSVTRGTTSATYTLAAKVSAGGPLFVSVTNAQGKAQVIPLVAAINRDAAPGQAHRPVAVVPSTPSAPAHTGTSTSHSGQGNAGGQGSSGGQGNAGSHGSGNGHGSTPPAAGGHH
ncbi:hypothetical protein [Deinococcus sonorensis]|uniref:DUF5666 domain-containing protein n=2 Tax=Deinococcus sonorensis TaxID=309891 RepID=A0AAU7UDY0_9DEIO